MNPHQDSPPCPFPRLQCAAFPSFGAPFAPRRYLFPRFSLSVSSVIIPPFRFSPTSPSLLSSSARLCVPLRLCAIFLRPFLAPHHRSAAAARRSRFHRDSSLFTAPFFSITYTLDFAQPLSAQAITHSRGRGYPQFPSHMIPTTYEVNLHARTHSIGPQHLPRPGRTAGAFRHRSLLAFASDTCRNDTTARPYCRGTRGPARAPASNQPEGPRGFPTKIVGTHTTRAPRYNRTSPSVPARNAG
jgi:hypothetical protein